MDWISRLNAAPPLQSDGAEIYHWAYEENLADNIAHRHTFFEICLVGAHGNGVFTVEGENLPITVGDLFIARPGVMHRIQNRGVPNMELFWVAFDWNEKRFDAASESDKDSPTRGVLRALAHSPIVVAHDDGLILDLWRALRAVAAGAQHAGKDAQLAALQRALLLQIAATGAGEGEGAPEAPLPTPTPHHLARLGARYIQDNLARKLSITEIAAHLHLSPRHFQRVFAEFTGVSPSVYLEAARIDRARHLMHSTNEPIKSIAVAVGLPDVHHFTRVFSRNCGVSPAAYRQLKKDAVRIVHKEGALV